MRQDFHKVVIERPRSGRSMAPYSKRAERRILNSFDDEDWIGHSSINPGKYRKERKNLSDLLGPLKRYLLRSVGRPWNDVYSEITKGMPSGMHRDHILSHVKQMVETNSVILDGKIISSAHTRFRSLREREVEGLFVHPGTGKLAYNQPKSRKRNQSMNWMIALPVEKRIIDVEVPSELQYIPFSRIDPKITYAAPLISVERKVLIRTILKKEYSGSERRFMGFRDPVAKYHWRLHESWFIPHFYGKVDERTGQVTEYKFHGMKEVSKSITIPENEYGKYGLQIPATGA